MASILNLSSLKTNEGSNLARKHDQLVDIVRSVIVCPGVGYQRTITPLGTILRIKPGKSSANHPFKLIDASEEDTKKIRVVYGTVNGSEPTGMSPGDNPQYVLDVGQSGYVYLIVTLDDDDFVNSVSIDTATSVPTDGDTYKLQLGSFSVDENGNLHIAQAVTSSLAFQLCGLSPLWGTA